MIQIIHQEVASHDPLPVTQMCAALDVARADYYRHHFPQSEVDVDLELRDSIQRIALEMSAYGYRRITHELRRRGVVVNHKRVLRLMRADNLLCLRKKSFTTTTDSRHSFTVYPNLVPALIITGIDQLWVADITYIRVQREFIYLAVILDAFSRRCIGWHLDRTLEADLATSALKMAVASRMIQPGLVHHSDRGVQYASTGYTNLLKEHGIWISMSRRGNPYDNAKAESFMKTLKFEEVYLYEYEDLFEALARIGHFLEEVYNQKRLHSALGYMPPAEFEQTLYHSTLA
jgi:putative transposase